MKNHSIVWWFFLSSSSLYLFRTLQNYCYCCKAMFIRFFLTKPFFLFFVVVSSFLMIKAQKMKPSESVKEKYKFSIVLNGWRVDKFCCLFSIARHHERSREMINLQSWNCRSHILIHNFFHVVYCHKNIIMRKLINFLLEVIFFTRLLFGELHRWHKHRKKERSHT